MSTKIYKLLIALALAFGASLLPFVMESFQVTAIQHILLFLFVLAASLWLLEPIPVYATSLLVMGAMCALISNSAITPLQNYLVETDPSHLLKYNDILASFSSPIIILFLGGFALAIGSSKYKLDVNLASVLLKPFGTKTKFVMLGLMFITSLFAMFMSNTATTVMMITMIAPILAVIDKHDTGIKAMVLSIPFAANIGGIATPIGTPPNAIAISFMDKTQSISFFQWIIHSLPIAIICILVTWVILQIMFPSKQKNIHIHIDSKFNKDFKSIVVYLTFIATIILWMTEKLHGVNSYTVSLLPLIVFTCMRIINVEDIKSMNWDVIWLVAGGIALGNALSTTGLANVLAHLIDYSQFNSFALIMVISMVGWLISNFVSSTATANLMIPISIAILSTYSGEESINTNYALMVIAIIMSFGMSLPISTPPNALAYSTGHITNWDMLKSGGTVGIICCILTGIFFYFVI